MQLWNSIKQYNAIIFLTYNQKEIDGVVEAQKNKKSESCLSKYLQYIRNDRLPMFANW